MNIPSPTDEAVVEPKPNEDLSFASSKMELFKIIDTFGQEQVKTEQRRRNRDSYLDVESMRKDGRIAPDETFIPLRIIDTNIVREQPPYIAFLKAQRRIAIFQERHNYTNDCQEIEKQFTQGMTYAGWELPFFRCLDGAQLHGWDAVEVVFDQTKPLHVGVEQVGHDNLIFPDSTQDIQFVKNLIRRYKLTIPQLEAFVRDFGFSEIEVQTLKDKYDQKSGKEREVVCYKRFFRIDGVVYVAWFSKEGTDWLKAPVPAYVGIKHLEMQEEVVQIPEKILPLGTNGEMVVLSAHVEMIPKEVLVDTPLQNYPIFILPFKETENAPIFSHKGRGETDLNKQEAMAAIASGFVNGTLRASKIYGSPATDTNGTTTIKVLEGINFKNGSILNVPIKFFNTPYPDSSVLQGLQYFDVQNSQENSQTTFAVNNRQDSRKTAREISAAQEQADQLNSVQVALFSVFLRNVYSFAWLIVQSQAIQNQIAFMPIIGPDGRWTGENDLSLVERDYDIRAAGDVDVIQRAEKLNQMQNFFSVITQLQNTQGNPLARVFLIDMLALAFPDDVERYRAALGQFDELMNFKQMTVGAMQQIATVLSGVQLPPEVQAQLQQIGRQVLQTLNAGTQPNAGPQSQVAQRSMDEQPTN